VAALIGAATLVPRTAEATQATTYTVNSTAAERVTPLVLGKAKSVELPDDDLVRVTVDRIIDPASPTKAYSWQVPDPGYIFAGVVVTVVVPNYSASGEQADDAYDVDDDWVSVYGSDGQEYNDESTEGGSAVPLLAGCADLTTAGSAQKRVSTGCVGFELPTFVKVARVQYYNVDWTISSPHASTGPSKPGSFVPRITVSPKTLSKSVNLPFSSKYQFTFNLRVVALRGSQCNVSIGDGFGGEYPPTQALNCSSGKWLGKYSVIVDGKNIPVSATLYVTFTVSGAGEKTTSVSATIGFDVHLD